MQLTIIKYQVYKVFSQVSEIAHYVVSVAGDTKTISFRIECMAEQILLAIEE